MIGAVLGTPCGFTVRLPLAFFWLWVELGSFGSGGKGCQLVSAKRARPNTVRMLNRITAGVEAPKFRWIIGRIVVMRSWRLSARLRAHPSLPPPAPFGLGRMWKDRGAPYGRTD